MLGGSKRSPAGNAKKPQPLRYFTLYGPAGSAGTIPGKT